MPISLCFSACCQRWCYQGGEEYFRMGYVVYLRYPGTGFDPLSALRIPAERGQPPSPAWMCGAELADRLRQLPGLRVLPLDVVDNRQARNCIAIRRDLGYIAILEDLGEVLCGSL